MVRCLNGSWQAPPAHVPSEGLVALGAALLESDVSFLLPRDFTFFFGSEEIQFSVF
jgi:hypothetical protein